MPDFKLPKADVTSALRAARRSAFNAKYGSEQVWRKEQRRLPADKVDALYDRLSREALDEQHRRGNEDRKISEQAAAISQGKWPSPDSDPD